MEEEKKYQIVLSLIPFFHRQAAIVSCYNMYFQEIERLEEIKKANIEKFVNTLRWITVSKLILKIIIN